MAYIRWSDTDENGQLSDVYVWSGVKSTHLHYYTCQFHPDRFMGYEDFELMKAQDMVDRLQKLKSNGVIVPPRVFDRLKIAVDEDNTRKWKKKFFQQSPGKRRGGNIAKRKKVG